MNVNLQKYVYASRQKGVKVLHLSFTHIVSPLLLFPVEAATGKLPLSCISMAGAPVTRNGAWPFAYHVLPLPRL